MRNERKFSFYVLFLGLIISYSSTFAQASWGPAPSAPSMAQVNAALSRVAFSNMALFRYNWYNNPQINLKYKYTVLYKDSTTKVIESKIHADTARKMDYLLFVNKYLPRKDPNRETKIYVDQTLAISRDTYDGNKVGEAADSCWRFDVTRSYINIFSSLSDAENIIGIQLNDGPIVAFNAANVRSMIGDDEKALKQLEKKNLYKAITTFNSNMKKRDEERLKAENKVKSNP